MGGNGTAGPVSSSSSPCASCRLLRRRCANDCVFAPYFPANDPQRFAIVHKIFGASNVSKMLQEIAVNQRCDAVNSLVYEASARVRDPVYGCVGAIYMLQKQVSELQTQLAVAQAEIKNCIRQMQTTSTTSSPSSSSYCPTDHNNSSPGDHIFSNSGMNDSIRYNNNDYNLPERQNFLMDYYNSHTPGSTDTGDVMMHFQQDYLKMEESIWSYERGVK